jgi:hypothetical protein
MTIVILAFLAMASAAGAQDWDSGGSGGGGLKEEKKSEYLPPNPDKDPFLPLVKKDRPKRRESARQVQTNIKKPVQPSEPAVQEIEIKVLMILGNEERRMAMCEFQGQLKELKKDDNVPGFFKVVELKPDELVVFSHKTKRRRVFKMGK